VPNDPRNRSYNAEIGSSAIDFVFKPLMQRYQHAKSIFAMFSPISLKRKMGVFVELALSEVFDFGFVWW
jgi:hypothetical protein